MRIPVNPHLVDQIVNVVKPMAMPFAHVVLVTLALHQRVGQNVWSVRNVHWTKPVSIKNV
jgi:hypothetical protein